MLSFDDLKNGGVDRDVWTVCDDGSRYEGVYCQRFEMVFFCIPRNRKIVGYVLR